MKKISAFLLGAFVSISCLAQSQDVPQPEVEFRTGMPQPSPSEYITVCMRLSGNLIPDGYIVTSVFHDSACPSNDINQSGYDNAYSIKKPTALIEEACPGPIPKEYIFVREIPRTSCGFGKAVGMQIQRLQ